MKEHIFREYDVRGIIPDELDGKGVMKFGWAFASYIKDKTIVIARDNRISSPLIHEKLVKGLLKGGARIIDLGLCTTPMYYVIKKELKIQNGIMITASHNPKEYNGFKISFNEIGPAYGEDIKKFKDFVFAGKFTKAKGSYETFDGEKIYLETIKKGINLGKRKVKAVFDPGNGTSSIILPKILEMFDIEYEIINGESDGNFPNHHPDPCEEKNMLDLKNKINWLKYDIGVGIDGDGDRVGIIDNEGNLIPADYVMMIFYKYLKDTFKNKKAIMDVKCSKAMIDEMQKLNLPLEIGRTGNSYMNYKINTENYDFGGEFSGHMWFNDKFPGVDDGVYAGLRMIELLSNTNLNITDFTKDFSKYYNTPEIKIPIEEKYKDTIIRKVTWYCAEKGYKINDIDGVRIDFEDGFALVRKSNTTPNLTLRFEKDTEEELQKVQKEFMDLINEIKENL